MDKEKEEARIEAEEVEKLRVQYQDELNRMEEIRQQEAKHQMTENLRHIEDKKFMKHIEKMKEEVRRKKS